MSDFSCLRYRLIRYHDTAPMALPISSTTIRRLELTDADRVLEVPAVIVEPDPLDLGEQPHQEVTEQSRRDTRQRDGEPELGREARFPVIGDVRLFHRPTTRRECAV